MGNSKKDLSSMLTSNLSNLSHRLNYHHLTLHIHYSQQAPNVL